MTAEVVHLLPGAGKAHPVAEVFPLMTGPEFDALVNDIRQHGQREPIIMHDGMIVDGRNRLRACRVLGIEPRTVEWTGQADEVGDYIVSANLHRRQLSTSQRAMIAAKLATLKNGQRRSRVSGIQICVGEAAKALNVGSSIVGEARCVLAEGTQEEIADVVAGRRAVTTVGPAIRKRRTEPPQSARKQPPYSPERRERVRLHADIWNRLKGALDGLTSLPLPADVAKIVRANSNRQRKVSAKLTRSLNWLEEFARAYNTDAEKDAEPPPGDNHVHTSAGDPAAGGKQR